MTKYTPLEELSYEEATAELEDIVAELESSERTLKETLALFELGQALAMYCTDLLDEADLKVENIMEEVGEDLA